MKFQEGKKGTSIIKEDQVFQIPTHWIEAAKIAKQVLRAFKDKVLFEEFINWNHYKKFEHFVVRKQPIYICIRHTKHWLAQSLTEPGQSGYIKLNIDDRTIVDVNGVPQRNLLYDLIKSTLVHEIIHFFQDTFGLEEQLAFREKKKLDLFGNGFKSVRKSFLYATNWVEMDAELGTYFALHKFQVPTVQELVNYFYEWYQDVDLALAIGSYIYDYFIGGRKKLGLREKVFHNEMSVEDFVRA